MSRLNVVLKTLLASLTALLLATAAQGTGSVAVKAEKIYTVSGDPIMNGVVIIEDGKIADVGPADRVKIPSGMKVLEAAVVTPGLIDAHTVVGLAGQLNQPHDQDQIERSAPMQPELRAIDAYNARERLVEWVRGLGVTTLHTGHGPGALITGQTMIVKTAGDTVDQALVREIAMVAATMGDAAIGGGNPFGGGGRGGPPKSPGTRGKAAAMLRAELIRAREYAEKMAMSEDSEGKNSEGKDDEGKDDGGSKAPPRNLRLEALARVIAKEVPLMVTVQRHHDILTVLRIQREFGFDLVLDGVAEAYLVIDEIRRAGVPVIVHATMKRASGEAENLTLENAALISDAGIPFALQSGFESYVPKTRVVLFEAAVAASYGLGFDRALESITLGAARLLGIDDRVGSIEKGKDGDLALYDGDPFEYVSHCIGTVIDGEVVSDITR